jgi:glycerate kinase
VGEAAAPRIVVASDSFKGSLSSVDVGDAVRLGLLDAAPAAEVTVVPVADGGEGTVAAALSVGWRGVPVAVGGPTGEPVTATLAVLRRDGWVTVLVELADACGLGRLPGGVPAPMTASSRGLGEALLAALDLGADEVVVGVGGSASTDGGAGMLAALGARLHAADGRELTDGGGALADLARLDLCGLDPRLAATRLVLAADVASPLLGPTGAAAVFAPQKGASRRQVAALEAALTTWEQAVAAASPVPSSPDRAVSGRHPGAGAAGGVGFTLLAVLGAERRSGVDVVLDLVGLDAALAGRAGSDGLRERADLVITGEGALDEQTLAGKAVAGVARRAGADGIPVVAVCGRVDLDGDGLAALGLRAAYPLTDLEPDRDRSSAAAADLVRRTARRIAQEWVSPAPG